MQLNNSSLKILKLWQNWCIFRGESIHRYFTISNLKAGTFLQCKNVKLIKNDGSHSRGQYGLSQISKYYKLVHYKNEEGKVDALWDTILKFHACMHLKHSGMYENANAHDDTCWISKWWGSRGLAPWQGLQGGSDPLPRKFCISWAENVYFQAPFKVCAWKFTLKLCKCTQSFNFLVFSCSLLCSFTMPRIAIDFKQFVLTLTSLKEQFERVINYRSC